MRQAFLQDIIDHPEDDTPRLVFADWLYDNGELERSELIRLQCELALYPATWNNDHLFDKRWQALRQRELNLLLNPRYDWLSPPSGFHGAWGVSFGDDYFYAGFVSDDFPAVTMAVNFRRGFVEEIHCNCADWLAHGKQVVKEHPLQRVVITDKKPQHHIMLAEESFWSWCYDRGQKYPGNYIYEIPWVICKHLLPPGVSDYSLGLPMQVDYTSERDAVDCLSCACLAWARLP